MKTHATPIPARHWKHPDGRTASLFGSAPGPGFEVVTEGYTVQWDDGTTGCGRPPWALRSEAEAFCNTWNEARAARVAAAKGTP